MDIFLTSVVIISLILSIVLSIKISSDTAFLSRSNTLALKGISCIIIMFVHVPESHGNSLQDFVGSFAYVGVTAFFMISAYGCRISVENNKKYLDTFWFKRLLMLFIPAIMINLIHFFGSIVLNAKIDYSILYSFNYYIYAIIVAYFVFWIVWKIRIIKEWIKDYLIIIIIIIFSLITYFTEIHPFFLWPSESMGFVFGIILFKSMKTIQNLFRKKHIIVSFLFLFVSAFLAYIYIKTKYISFWGDYLTRIILAFSIILLWLSITAKFDFNKKNSPIEKLGGISYEVYLSHLMVIKLLDSLLPNTSSGIYIL